MSFGARLVRQSRPMDMEGDDDTSPQVKRVNQSNSGSPQSMMEGPIDASVQSDTSSGAGSSPQLGRIPGRFGSSGTRYGVGPSTQDQKGGHQRQRMSFGQRVGRKDSVQTRQPVPQKRGDLTHKKNPKDVVKK